LAKFRVVYKIQYPKKKRKLEAEKNMQEREKQENTEKNPKNSAYPFRIIVKSL